MNKSVLVISVVLILIGGMVFFFSDTIINYFVGGSSPAPSRESIRLSRRKAEDTVKISDVIEESESQEQAEDIEFDDDDKIVEEEISAIDDNLTESNTEEDNSEEDVFIAESEEENLSDEDEVFESSETADFETKIEDEEITEIKQKSEEILEVENIEAEKKDEIINDKIQTVDRIKTDKSQSYDKELMIVSNHFNNKDYEEVINFTEIMFEENKYDFNIIFMAGISAWNVNEYEYAKKYFNFIVENITLDSNNNRHINLWANKYLEKINF